MPRILSADDAAIREAAQVLQSGGLVAFPTETVYGLGANALDAAAVARIFAAKGRPSTNPLIVHVDGMEMLARIAELNPMAEHLIAAFWPGPLTLVLPKTPLVPDIVTAGGPTVAVRMPRHPVAVALLRASGLPLAAPSANRSEQLSPTRAEHVAESFAGSPLTPNPGGIGSGSPELGRGGSDLLILDGGPCAVGLESTVLDVTVSPPRILRPGMVTAAEIEAVLGASLGQVAPADGPVRSPGQMRRHYAPRTPLRIVSDVWAEARNRPLAVVLAHEPAPRSFSGVALTLPNEPIGYAARFYDALHELDHQNASEILVQSVPESDAWLAVRDRLQRASEQR